MASNQIQSSTTIHAAKEALVELRSSIENVKSLISNTLKLPSLSSSSSSPLQSLQRGNWVKLICGASFEDVVDIRNLSLVYTLSGDWNCRGAVDCIDCAADASVVSAVNEGILAAKEIAGLQKKPWVMISVNDDKDLHFRKAGWSHNRTLLRLWPLPSGLPL